MFPILLQVAPRAGAWIETKPEASAAASPTMSRPARARGLKLAQVRTAITTDPSRAPRGRVD